MADLRVWVDSLLPDNTRLLVWKDRHFFCAKVTETDQAAWEQRMRDARDPARELGPTCQVAPIEDVTRAEVVIGGETRIYYDDDRPQVMKILMVTDGQQVLDLVKEHHPDWQLKVRTENPLLAAAKGFGVCFFFAALFGIFYVLIENGIISRAHALIALIVNIAGTLPLLILAILFLVLGFVAAAFCYAKPAQTHVLRPSP